LEQRTAIVQQAVKLLPLHCGFLPHVIPHARVPLCFLGIA
jgi:hypothetical protein